MQYYHLAVGDCKHLSAICDPFGGHDAFGSRPKDLRNAVSIPYVDSSCRSDDQVILGWKGEDILIISAEFLYGDGRIVALWNTGH